MAFDVFMHLRQESEIVSGIANIYNTLNDKGLFLWYDVNEKTHFSDDEDDGRGFSEKEMDYYACQAGFCLVKKKHVYKTMPIYNTSTYYFAGKVDMLLLMILDKLLPTKQTINVRIYEK